MSIEGFSNRHNLDLDASERDDRHLIPGVMLTIANPAVLLFWSSIIDANLATKEFRAIWLLFLSTLIHGGRRFLTPQVFGYISLIAGLVLIGFGLSFGYRLAIKALRG